MLWIAALAVIAGMADELPIRDCAIGELPCDPMRMDRYAVMDTPRSVSVLLDVAAPGPALVWLADLDAAPEIGAAEFLGNPARHAYAPSGNM